LRVRLNELTRAPGSKKARKRVGRGTGSGRGKTSGRGHKGAGARSGVSAFAAYEGGQMPLQRRLPRLKGEARGRHTVARPAVYAPVNLSELHGLPGDTIGPDELRAAGLVRKKAELIKILGDGDIGRAVTVAAHAFSKTAREKIEAGGGSVEVLER
jgi:large subunit ribosomal protein L15